MNRNCENCKNAVVIMEPSIYKCKRDGTTKMFNDTCFYFKELIENKKENDYGKDFITDFFNNEIFKDKK